MKINLAYGKRGLEWNVPDGYHVDIIEPQWVEGLKDQTEAITEALRSPIDSKPLKDLVSKDTKIGIIFSDITRATPYHIILPALLKELDHADPKNIILFCATGTHRPAPPGELETILGKEIASKYRIIQNDTNDKSQFMHAGNTSSGNQIYLNAELAACDLKILTGFIEPHFFMGFSGGGKAVMPGMAYLDTIRYNHSISMLENENARWGITSGNPLWEDVNEAAELLSGLFLLNITLNKRREISGVYAGDLRKAHKQGCIFAKETAMVPVDESYDLVITSNDPYQAEVTVALSGTGVNTGNDLDLLPTVTELTGNYPNPFNPTTKIKFSLKADSKVSLSIYNVRGQKVKTLINDNMEAGYHTIVWDGRDDNGKSVSSGVYFNNFGSVNNSGDYTSVKKIILLK